MKEIDEALGQSAELKPNILDDLRQLKVDYRNKLTECIDGFTFKILSNIERDMKYGAYAFHFSANFFIGGIFVMNEVVLSEKFATFYAFMN